VSNVEAADKKAVYDSIIAAIEASIRRFPDNAYSSQSAIWDGFFERRTSPKQFQSFVHMLNRDSDITLGVANLSEPRFYAHYAKVFEALFSKEEVERLIPGETGHPTLIEVHGVPASIPVLQNETRIRQLAPYLPAGRRLRVLEIGAGYGGMADLLIKRGVVESYTIVDLPENLALAAFFLTLENPEFSSNVCPDKIGAEGSSLNFLLPNEIEKISDQKYDLVINCDSLGEMPASVARAYVDFISRHLSNDGIFYSKNGVQRGVGTCERLSNYGFEKFGIVDVLPTPFSTGMLDDHSTVLVLKKGRSEPGIWRSLNIVADLFKFGLTSEIEHLGSNIVKGTVSDAERKFLGAAEQLFTPPHGSRRVVDADFGTEELNQAYVYLSGIFEFVFGSLDAGRSRLERYLANAKSPVAESQAILILSGGTAKIRLDNLRDTKTSFYLSTTKIPIVADFTARGKIYRSAINLARLRFMRVRVLPPVTPMTRVAQFFSRGLRGIRRT
jgi:putative sugar O-methyltransferase